jgi:DNA processing protein
MDRLSACLYLQLLPQIGPLRAHQLIRHCGSPEAVFEVDPKALFAQKLLNSTTYNTLSKWRTYTQTVDAHLEVIAKHHWTCWLWDTSDYPHYLRYCPDAPLVLFHKGNWNTATKRVLSIVGTRSPSTYGI